MMSLKTSKGLNDKLYMRHGETFVCLGFCKACFSNFVTVINFG